MLIQVFLCVSVACLSLATPTTPPPSGGEPPEGPIAAEEFAQKAKYIMDRSKVVYGDMDLLKDAVGMHVVEKDWVGIINLYGKIMKESKSIFTETLDEIFVATERMFKGDNHFKHVTRCNHFVEIIKDGEFGSDSFAPKMAKAIEEDLCCMRFLVEEAFSWDVEKIKSGQFSEEDAVNELARTVLDLFRLRNDGLRFQKAVETATKKYGMHHHYVSAVEEQGNLVRELLRRLSD
ncbi:uncharacterized protein [Haliotis asinina]|uniref:uncharacterized protein n=1 Tax=Haliotis asinina TaxID=109174 RepID=UPI003531A97E